MGRTLAVGRWIMTSKPLALGAWRAKLNCTNVWREIGRPFRCSSGVRRDTFSWPSIHVSLVSRRVLDPAQPPFQLTHIIQGKEWMTSEILKTKYFEKKKKIKSSTFPRREIKNNIQQTQNKQIITKTTKNNKNKTLQKQNYQKKTTKTKAHQLLPRPALTATSHMAIHSAVSR